eukprot:CAMPEP_0170133950 /NCGR_PEP_ID=MMETSP0033_2-20121228/1627_1 /TAXON_ID=195969 /ORGANISM="Dolichomastix tenuilepis, Strain CCMP3274" /LENGTH=179 /DNA_ID=CAMNT_0010369485 /DNA_START=46 /DNA_END=581 /DNA_ORIENTATION=+
MLGVVKSFKAANRAQDSFADPTKGGNVDLGREGAPVVVFNASKREQFTPSSGYKQLFRRLRATYQPRVNKDEISTDTLADANIFVLAQPRERFTTSEFEVIRSFVMRGGSLLIMMGEGGEQKAGTNVNYLLEEFGISVNQDAVVRTVHYKYLHPKEVLITDGVMNRSMLKHVSAKAKGG